ncbi:MAG: tRNA dihydrouridine synthase DusB [Acholeplasmataceae bacterium]|jgi:nifR3 family TIM-barrel protein
MFKIGNVTIENKLILAPMAGVSNIAFRKICKEMGAGLVVGEMVSDYALHYENRKTINLLTIDPDESPISQQIFGSNLEYLVKAAKYLDEYTDCDIIDINMGCPVPKVAVKSQAGAALLKDPIKIYEIVKTVKNAVRKPVTVKIRSGWDYHSINAIEVAKIIEKAGADAITIHARTRSQGYSGKADWKIIKEVKEAVNIPVIGNGDVTNGKSAKQMLEETGCDAVMIGRAAVGNPWIFREINYFLETGKELPRPTYNEILEVMILHLDSLIELKGEKIAVLEMRGLGSSYLSGLPNNSIAKQKLAKTNNKEEYINVIKEYFNSLKNDLL